jgi:hypothetical protein
MSRTEPPPSSRSTVSSPFRRAVLPFVVPLFALGACDSASTEEPAATVGEGDPYPALTVQDCDGNPVDMQAWVASHDASYITFGAQWCVACQEEAPVINRELVDGLAGESVGLVQILVEADPGVAPPAALCAAWKNDLGARYEVFVDTAQNHLGPVFGGSASTLPLHIITTKDGVIRLRKSGAIPDDIKAVVEGWLP